jgi:hypothetical protein
MADVERIAPPVPTLPPPVGRGVGTNRRGQRERPPPAERKPEPPRKDDRQPPDHIDEYI